MLDGVDVVDRPARAHRRRRPQRHGQDHAAAAARRARARPTRRGHRARRRPRRSATCRRSPNAATRRCSRYLARRTGVTAAEAELERATAALADVPDDGADDAYADALDATWRVGGPDLDARVRAACRRRRARRRDSLDVPMRVAVGRRRRRAASLAAILLAGFDVFLLDEPTNDLDFAGLERLEAFLDGPARRRGGREPRPRVPRADRHRVCSSSTSTPTGDRVRRRVARLPRRAGDRAPARRGGLRDVPRRAQPLGAARARTQREWAVQGVAKAKKDTRRTDKNIRHFQRRDVGEAGGQGRRPPSEAIDRLDVGRRSRGRAGTCASRSRPRRAAATWWRGSTARSSSAARSRSARSTSRSAGETAWRILGPNGSGKTTLLLALLGRLPLRRRRALAGPGRGRRRARPGARRRSRRGGRVARCVQSPPPGCRSARPGRCSPSSGSAPSTWSGRRTRCRPGSAPGPCSPALAAQGVNCLVLDEPTNHLDLEAIEQLEQALDELRRHAAAGHPRPAAARGGGADPRHHGDGRGDRTGLTPGSPASLSSRRPTGPCPATGRGPRPSRPGRTATPGWAARRRGRRGPRARR